MRVLSGRTVAAALSAVLLAGSVAACSSGSKASAQGLTAVTLALDWTPNTNHTGIYVADKLGYYKDAGIDLHLIPYGSTDVETLVSSHKVDYGISYQEGVTTTAALGGDIVSIFAITQKTNVEIAVRANSGITSPKQLDGKTYAGFGAPYEAPLLRYVIQHAGGKGDFKYVNLNTSAYDALYSGQADFAMPEPTWETLQAKLEKKPLTTFQLSDYGFPQIYSVLIASSSAFLTTHPDLTRRFIAATEKGYTYAAEHPQQAATILIDENKSALDSNTELVQQSAALEAKEFYRDPSGKIGVQTATRWQALTDFMFHAGILSGPDGRPLSKDLDSTKLFTDAYLPAQ